MLCVLGCWGLWALVSCANQIGTVGALLGRDPEGHLVIRRAPQGLAAANAGLQAGDEVLLIEGQDVRELSEKDVHAVLSGEPGTRVRLTLQRGSEVVRVELVRTAAVKSGLHAR